MCVCVCVRVGGEKDIYRERGREKEREIFEGNLENQIDIFRSCCGVIRKEMGLFNVKEFLQ